MPNAVVVGAGMAGLSTAWFLQERGFEVTVVERRRVAAGASWGNAGWLTPAFTVPLPAPAMFRAGPRHLLSPASPLYIPPRLDPSMARFLFALSRHCTRRAWQVSMSALAPLNRQALAAYDALAEGGVSEPTSRDGPILVAFESELERQREVDELERVRAHTQDVRYEMLTGTRARELEPTLSDRVESALVVHQQRYLHPGRYMAALAASVRGRGGTITEGNQVTDVRASRRGVEVGELRADVAVLACGAWLSSLGRRFGVRRPVRAGRGYSFSVSGGPSLPTYFPGHKVVCTPLGDRVRVAGMMEFTGADRPLDRRRVAAVVAAARGLLRDVDWERRTDEWVGPRPCTPDGLPLVGPTLSPRVFVCGGHSMWGIALGPLTGRLLAELIATGRTPAELAALHPLR